ncbi:hypothetical protein QBC37DRAFT_78882 [Rhypophila decipiens]|uniref:Uncharacterized protein n=1 Tax=Rhypophila decipiens TaxID=261697 RepID=A0AAN6XXC7_9PEZI|nr:hypothetical protein QBC37DRAFT_78882 [Rhypophila decipiens]
MQINSILISFSLFATAILASPAALAPRGGDHTATVFSGNSCTGTAIQSEENFGCGGVCFSVGQDINSILLNQATTGNPKPTADLWSGDDCDGTKVGHAGIFSGQNAGCTTLSSPARSYFLFFDC